MLFALALEKPADKRAAFLDATCEGDPALRQRLEALLSAHSAPDELPFTSAAKATMKLELADAPDEVIGQKIGRYKIMECVGEGGCGVVYVAEQTEPVRRRIALKVIKLGMDTKAVVARFEAERQALAMMDHPNIAKVLDAGTTETGRPFFVMELVRGIRITDYCDQNNLSTKERLDLFIKICQAIQHAHQKGIIHRDIKPSNILVTLHDGVPVPKVIDFGIAKATEGRLTDATVYTQLHQFIGTPAYMSPEQAEMSGLDIDTRSDIYSLGVLLYELLAGSTPFDAQELMSQGIDQMRKTIREKEPVRPSTRFATLKGEELTTTAKRRSADKSKLMHDLKGDLDWIVMKCLEKDRTRRYETANGIAADLKRHLNNEPIVARPPSSAYRFQKLVRRNKLAFVAAGAVAAALLLGIIGSAAQAIRATHAKREALAAQAQEAVQRKNAEASEQKAVAAQASETKLREQAQAAELAARRRAYASDMNVAQQALAGNNLGRALDLLNRQRPQPGQQDLRGWEWRYLWGQTHGDALFTLCKEPAEINSLSVSPDGLSVAIGSYHGGGVSVWDLRTRQELIRLAKNEGFVRAAFSPTEPLLAFAGGSYSASGDTLHVWNTATRQTVAEMPLDGDCAGLAFAKDGRTLVTSTSYHNIKGNLTLWRMPDGIKLASHTADIQLLSPATSFAATPDLSLAAYATGSSPGQRIAVMNLRTGTNLWTAVAAKVDITALAFSPDGKTLASAAGFAESDIRLWDVATGKEIGKLAGHGSWVSSLVFSPDGKKLISSSADQTIRTWDVADQKCLDVLRGHRQEVWRLALLPDGRTLVSGGKDGTVCFWDTSVPHPGQPRIKVSTNVVNWCFVPDSRSLLTLNRQGKVARWSDANFQQKEPLLEIGTPVGSSLGFQSFSPDRHYLTAGSFNGVLKIWDVTRRKLYQQWTNGTGAVAPDSFLAEGNKLITWSGKDQLFHEWESATGRELWSWRMPENWEGALAVSPDGQSCVSVGYEGEVTLKNLTDGNQTRLNLDILEGAYASYSPDGKWFAVASDLGFARVWNTANWQPVATAGGFLNGAHSVAFSPDNQRLAVGSGGQEAVKLWDPESWQNVFTLEAPGTDFFQLAFSPDGNTLGWLNQENVLYLWRAPSWAEINAAEKVQMESSKTP
jgi:WD40 repeat protein/tRNA A-37 threonylcarbamoyl transferase component Bud32/cell division protein FtsL